MWRPFEKFSRPRAVALGESDLTIAGRGVLGFQVASRRVRNQLREFPNTCLGLSCDVKHLPGGCRSFGGADECVHDICHVREVPRLLAVSVDQRSTALGDCGDKARDNRGVFGVGALAWPVDIEETQGGRRQTIDRMKCPAVLLGSELRHGVGRKGQRKISLALRKSRVRPIHRR